MGEAGTFTAKGIDDLNMLVINLSQQGFRIVTVIGTKSEDYHVIAQKESNDLIEAYVRTKERIQERVDHLRTHGHTHVQAVLQGTLEAILKDMP